MRNKKGFNNLVYNNLKENRAFSLSALLNEEKEESADLFDLPDDEESDDSPDSDEGSNTDVDSGSEESSDIGTPEEDSEEDSEAVELQNAYAMIDRLSNVVKLRTPELGDTISSITKENYSKKVKLRNFMFLNEDNASSIVKDMENALTKNDELLDKVKKQKAELEAGTEISVQDEVRIAIDKLIHFKEKVDIIDLIEELFINKIRLIAPIEDVESAVEEFIESYRDEVHKHRAQIDIPGSKHYNDESVYLDKNDNYNGAVGARSQG